jgi:GxxExxY protein
MNADKHKTSCDEESIRVYSGGLKYEEVSRQILKASFEVHNILGCGFLEKVYENALVRELNLLGLKVQNQKEVSVHYKGKEVGSYLADLVVEDKVIVELKVAEEISKIHQAQILNYLKAGGYEVGLILNFSKPKLQWKRLVVSRDKREL